MKKLLLSTVLVAFAVAVQAGDAKPTQDTAQPKSACCAKKASAEAKAECPMAIQAKAECSMATQAKAECSKADQAKASCCPMNKKASQTAAVKGTSAKRLALLSPKAIDTAIR